MIILAIETSMGVSSVAIRVNGELRVESFGGAAREQSESLLPMILDAMTREAVSFNDLTRIAVTTGPGTFTGIRASLAAAKGFALARKIDVVGVPSLEVMAHIFAHQQCGRPFIVTAPAGRDMVYVQKFDARGASMSAPAVELLSSLPNLALSNEFLFVGPGAVSVPGALATNLAPTASALAEMAETRHPSDKLAPLYLRPADAKPQQSKILPRAMA